MDYQLWLGDCLEEMDRIESGSVDAIIADLPYGTTACKWDTVIPFEPLWKQYKRVIKKNGAVVLFGSEPFSSLLRLSNLEWYKYDWVWDKVTARGHLVAKIRPMQQTECISVFGKSINYYPIMVNRPVNKIENRLTTEYARTEIMGGQKRNTGSKIYDKWYPKTLLTYSNASSSVNSIHPTQKPVALLSYLIKTYTNEGDTVLDNTCGSGSTLEAAMRNNRHSIGIEKDLNYFNVAQQRLERVAAELRGELTHLPMFAEAAV